MRRLLVHIVPVGVLLVASCGSSDGATSTTVVPTSGSVTTTVPDSTVPPTTAPATTEPTTEPTGTLPAEEQDAIAYFVRGEHLVAVRRSIPEWEGVPLMTQLLAGPTAAEVADGVGTAIPEGTAVLGVRVAANRATVDLSGAFSSGGGSLSMQLRVAQVVYTLSQLPNVDVVSFRIDGEPVSNVGGEGVMVIDVGRSDFEAMLPEIFVESPLDGDPWVDPMMLAGSASTFEATVNYEVVDAVGAVIQQGVTTATCGTGCVGIFVVELDPLPAGTPMPVTVRAFDISEADGSVIDLVEVMVG